MLIILVFIFLRFPNSAALQSGDSARNRGVAQKGFGARIGRKNFQMAKLQRQGVQAWYVF
jgi:hypothetical protein